MDSFWLRNHKYICLAYIWYSCSGPYWSLIHFISLSSPLTIVVGTGVSNVCVTWCDNSRVSPVQQTRDLLLLLGFERHSFVRIPPNASSDAITSFEPWGPPITLLLSSHLPITLHSYHRRINYFNISGCHPPSPITRVSPVAVPRATSLPPNSGAAAFSWLQSAMSAYSLIFSSFYSVLPFIRWIKNIYTLR